MSRLNCNSLGFRCERWGCLEELKSSGAKITYPFENIEGSVFDDHGHPDRTINSLRARLACWADEALAVAAAWAC